MSQNLFSFVLLFVFLAPFSCQFTAKEAVQLMQRGINIGDSFDAPEGETYWGNPQVQEYYFDDYKAAGINAVRLPVTWNLHTANTAPYTIDATFLSRIEEVVDWAISRGLFLCLNAHHEGWLKNPTACSGCGFTQSNYDRFNAIWKQVAERLKDKSYYLMFEILNEPENMTLDHLNQIHSRVVKTIRASGGNNAKRLIVFSGPWYSGPEQLVTVTIPETDHKYLIANFHIYEPWSFVTDLTGKPKWSTENENAVKALFDQAKKWATLHDISVMFNEWACSFNKHDYVSVMAFYEHYVSSAVANGFSAFAWDDGYDFTTYERKTRTWRGDLIDVLTNPAFTQSGMKTVGYVAKSGVSRKASSNGNYVGDIDSGDWMAYRLNVPQAGIYKLELTVSSRNAKGVIHFRSKAGDVNYATLSVPNTGGDETWVTISKYVTLAKGLQNFALAATTGGFNVKWMRLTSGGSQVKVTGVTVSSNGFKVAVNNNYQLEAQVLPSSATNNVVQWKSKNPSIARVDAQGLVTGVAVGSTQIVATTVDGGFTDSSSVTVVKIPVSGMAFSQTSLSLIVGNTATLSVQVKPSNASEKTVSFTSSNTAVAKVDSQGVVTAVGAGKATVTLKTKEGGFTAKCAVTVSCLQWTANTNYPVGDVIEYKGQTYTSNNPWNSAAPDPYTATHTTSGWGWTIGGTCH